MLLELVIKNIAIIDQLRLSFSSGLNILSGETGAGKSIIIDAINLLLGGRIFQEIIRTQAEEAMVEAIFDISGQEEIKRRLRERGLPEENNLLLKRVISRSGRNRVYINGNLATVGILSEISRGLVDIYGQHEHQSLMQEDKHVDILDEFGGLWPLRSEVGALHDKLVKLSREYQRLKQSEESRKEHEALLQFQSQEIQAAGLNPGEEENLENERRVLMNSGQLLEATSKGEELIYSAEGSIVEKLGELTNRIKDLTSVDHSLKSLAEDLESARYKLEDIALSLRQYASKISFEPGRLEEVETRLDAINKLKRKYGSNVADILIYKERIDKELEELGGREEQISEITKELEELKSQALVQSQLLSQRRQKVAQQLSKKVEAELSTLGMKKTVFRVNIEQEQAAEGSDSRGKIEINGFNLSPQGIDLVEYLISPNIGEEPKPLSKIASGGELSRIMLALKRILLKVGEVVTMIFDEVDAGIGGAIAEVVGKKLNEVAEGSQVLCVTHLPQIACYADIHYYVSKMVEGKRTITTVKKLEDKERIEEISRMLAGIKITDKSREYAREMVESARRK
ncbi:MAG: DNA repair protein RecN [Deltaproteobacteria bacterium]|nr:MAG: DNA repair protein RecN [Deltaproteobacteria bacterium]